ncbi:MAG TPA: HAD-IA family hydrolase [Solirubrobacteraceae bacterium]|nr:HAD-IA family hydrolase [Solirubrobacteraceae bacterium]
MRPRAVLLDALGTLVRLDAPWPRLVRELAARGIGVSLADAEAALRSEMAYYRTHHDVARDRAGLAALRADCAAVLRDALPERVREALAPEQWADVLLAALRFEAYPEVPDTLRALREEGARLVVVSNWDVSLHDVLHDTGLRPLVDAVVTSAELGAAKPHPAIFARALELAGGVAPADALHAGDSVEADVEGALAAGIAAVLVDRAGELRAPAGARVVRSLDGLLPAAPYPPG